MLAGCSAECLKSIISAHDLQLFAQEQILAILIINKKLFYHKTMFDF